MSVPATTQPAKTAPAFQRRGLSLRLRLVLLILAITMPVLLIIALAMHTEVNGCCWSMRTRRSPPAITR